MTSKPASPAPDGPQKTNGSTNANASATSASQAGKNASPSTASAAANANGEKSRRLVDEWRAASRLVVDAAKEVTSTVEKMHQEIGGGPAILGKPFAPFIKLFSGPVYASIRGVAELAGIGIDKALTELAPAFDDAVPAREYEAARAALNGVLGDHLAERNNPLAIPMSLRVNDETLVEDDRTAPTMNSGDVNNDVNDDGKTKFAPVIDAAELARKIPNARARLLIVVHGSAMNDDQMTRKGHSHAHVLAESFGFTPVFVRYNSGLHISKNGRTLASMLDAVVTAWPTPVSDIAVLGFSMGGLVMRSAVHIAEEDDLAWRRRLKSIIFLGTPHHGAPLERLGNVADFALDVSRYSAPLARLAKIRSAGVTDLRYGNVLDAHWHGQDRFALKGDPRDVCALPDDVSCFAIAGTMNAMSDDKAATVATSDEVKESSSESGEPNALGLFGDGLVPVESALGRHKDEKRALAFPTSHQFIVRNVAHLDLLESKDALSKMTTWWTPLFLEKV